MKNKLYRINHRPGRYIDLAQMHINATASINKRYQNFKQINSLEDEENFKKGFVLGIQNIKLDENNISKSIFFQRGYLLGQRKYEAIETEKQQKIIAAFIELNISLEDFPEYIKNNTQHRSTYIIESCKQRKLKK